jgi:hypothetical protein
LARRSAISQRPSRIWFFSTGLKSQIHFLAGASGSLNSESRRQGTQIQSVDQSV